MIGSFEGSHPAPVNKRSAGKRKNNDIGGKPQMRNGGKQRSNGRRQNLPIRNRRVLSTKLRHGKKRSGSASILNKHGGDSWDSHQQG